MLISKKIRLPLGYVKWSYLKAAWFCYKKTHGLKSKDGKNLLLEVNL